MLTASLISSVIATSCPRRHDLSGPDDSIRRAVLWTIPSRRRHGAEGLEDKPIATLETICVNHTATLVKGEATVLLPTGRS